MTRADLAARLRCVEAALNETSPVSSLIPSWEACIEAADRLYDSYWIDVHRSGYDGEIEPGSIMDMTWQLTDSEVGSDSWQEASNSLYRIATNRHARQVEGPNALDVRLARFFWCWIAEYFKRGRGGPAGWKRTKPDTSQSVPDSH